ncbi:CPBP family intramembrane glutamic endopeptidase [Halosolutus halophilus]|uniref:CPBP family intramembrane glutamic endopeptidase n=1 Tax=Halosolutus halophilus TaxID=1552990 RepID=UPI0022352500|nr:CPBP family intramembrane glutamic endopeptidase [Halosolutus halophilus]
MAFGISWSGALLVAIAKIDLASIQGIVLVVVLYMWAPAIAALITQLRTGASIRVGCGLFRGRLRWVGLAWLTPVALLVLTIGIGALFPDVTITTDYAAFLRGLGLPESQIEESLAVLAEVPVPTPVFFVLQGLLGGLTINAVAALGEELGWRGLLLRELSPLGFWRVSLLTGVVWGIWHAPLIVQGHNFPDAPYLGILVMTGWTVAATPVFTYLTVRAESVFAPTLLHGSFNAVASLSLVYLTGAGALFVGPVGIAGIGAGLFATAACVVHDRYIAGRPLTTGGALPTWEAR